MEIITELFDKAFPGKCIVTESPSNYWAILGPTGYPRWIVPNLSRAGIPALKQWHPFNIASKLKWSAFLSFYRSGCISRMPNVKPIHIQHLNTFGDDDNIPVFYIGTPSRVQKMVVTLVNPTTNQLSTVAKIPVEKGAAETIIHEAKTLHWLNSWKYKISPSLHSLNPDTGISLQEVIAGRLAGFNLTDEHLQLLASLKYDNDFTTLSEHASSLQIQIESTNPDSIELKAFRRICQFLQDDALLPAFQGHGDFSPWNILRTKQGLMLVDWERAQKISLPLLDLFHFLTMQRLIRNQPLISDLSAHPLALKHLQRTDIILPRDLLEKILLYYFLTQWLNARRESPQNAHALFRELQAYWEKIR